VTNTHVKYKDSATFRSIAIEDKTFDLCHVNSSVLVGDTITYKECADILEIPKRSIEAEVIFIDSSTLIQVDGNFFVVMSIQIKPHTIKGEEVQIG
jgi:hypothetical protein